MRIFRAAKCQGYSLIEQAAVLPILLAFIFGAIDVNRILHAYTAMEAGVDSALRCVYPVDGKCISVTPAAREPLYKVTLSEGTPIYHTTTYDYSGVASWLELPSYSHDHFNARILDQLSVSMTDSLLRAVKPYYEVSADYGYWIRTFESPYFTGDALEGTAKYGPGGSSVSPHRTISLSGIDLSSDGTISDYVDFKIDSPASGTSVNNNLCFESTKVGTTGTHTPSFKKSCASGSLFSWNDPTNQKELETTGHIVFHITGSANAARGTTGSVAITLVYPIEDQPADRKKIDLGGRLLSAGGSGNFVPRGVPAGMVDDDTNTYPEFDNKDYQSIKIPYGKTVRLKFTLEDQTGSGKYSWSGDKLKIWLPQYTYKSGSTLCSDPLPELDKNSVSKCKPTDTTWADASVLSETNPSSKIVKSTKLDLGCDQLTDAKSTISSLVKDAGNYVSTEKVSSAQCPGFSKAKFSCPTTNLGITRNSKPTSGELVKACGASIKYNGQAIDPNKLSVTSTTRDTAQKISPTFSWKPSNCDTLTVPSSSLASLAGAYKDWWFDAAVKTGNGTQVFTDPKSPAEFKKASKALACDEVSTKTALYDQNSLVKVENGSTFSGERDELCGDWKKALRDEAINLGMSSKSFFEPQAKAINSSTTEIQKPGSCYRSSFKPSDAAAKDLGIFTNGSLPDECSKPGKYCSLSFAGLTEDATGETIIDLEAAAREVGFSAIKAAMPTARLACRGEDCISIEVRDDAGIMRASASTEIRPLLLFGKSVPIKYSNFRAREDQFAR